VKPSLTSQLPAKAEDFDSSSSPVITRHPLFQQEKLRIGAVGRAETESHGKGFEQQARDCGMHAPSAEGMMRDFHAGMREEGTRERGQEAAESSQLASLEGLREVSCGIEPHGTVRAQ